MWLYYTLSNIYIFLWPQICCRNFCVRRDFVSNPKTLRKRLMVVGLAMLLVSPFLVIFMLVYLFLRHAEQFYNHPSTASSRRWSNLSRWIFREFNEVLLFFIFLLFSALFAAFMVLQRTTYTLMPCHQDQFPKRLCCFMEALERLYI